MKRIFSVLAIVGTTLAVNAQNLPKSSPKTEVEQFVGATAIEIDYSRPGVKERTIFGGLVPFDQLWRFGANSATTIETDHSLFFDGKELKAGTYSVFAIPGKETWEILFNTDKDASVETYDERKTILKTTGKVSENSFTESLYIGFDNIKDESANIVALWEKTKVEIPFTVKTKENSISNIKKAIKEGDDLANVYSNAANYYYSIKDSKQALTYVNESIKIESNFRNLFLKARITFEAGDKKEAISTGKKALELADKAGAIGYKNYIKGTIEKWEK